MTRSLVLSSLILAMSACAFVSCVHAQASEDEASSEAPAAPGCQGSDCDGAGGGGIDGGGDSGAVCPHLGPPVIDPATLPACNGCGDGHCVPNGLVPEDVAGSLAECDDSAMCVPDDFIETAGNFIADSCESVLGAEGRCLSTCLPLVAEQADQLPKSSCPTNQRCVPCFDPFDGAETGACALSCDPGPSEPPIEFPRCCGDIGSCLPKDLVPGDQVDSFDGYDCPQGNGDMICVPTAYLYPPYQPPACETGWTSSIFGAKYEPGACVPECLAAVQGIFNSLVLGQDGCPGGHVCAPCLVPTSGDPSGACTVIGGSCEDACGGEAPDGCWCDAECMQYGDCCMDACAACGVCG